MVTLERLDEVPGRYARVSVEQHNALIWAFNELVGILEALVNELGHDIPTPPSCDRQHDD